MHPNLNQFGQSTIIIPDRTDNADGTMRQMQSESQPNNATLNRILNSDRYKVELDFIAARIAGKSKAAPNEATIESYFDCELFAFFRECFSGFGFEYNPVKEASVNTKRHITKGRMDTAIATLVIEFKRPDTLSSPTQEEEAIAQIKDYMTAKAQEEKAIEGFVTDGIKGCFLKLESGEIKRDAFRPIESVTLDRIVRNILDLERLAFNGETLVKVLCKNPTSEPLAFALAKNLYSQLLTNASPKTQMLFQEWMQLFNLAHDDASKQQAIIDRSLSLENLLNTKFGSKEQEYKALFALQTAYAIIVKAIALKVVSQARYNQSLIDFDELRDLEAEALRTRLSRMENGDLLRDYGIANLLEGDFFSWYASESQWSTDLAKTLSGLFGALSHFTDRQVLNSGSSSQDFFKSLYTEMMPGSVRHSLGEYYTKRWLAKEVVKGALEEYGEPRWRALDPTCGSGTFLITLIDEVLKETAGKSAKEQLDAVLSRVCGIDLNPIAVLTARVNYYLNIAHLATDNDPFEIPVFLGDASYTPTHTTIDGVSCSEYVIQTLKKPIHVVLPTSALNDLARFSANMTEMETWISVQDIDAVTELLNGMVAEDDRTETVLNVLKQLAESLVDLEAKGWNGIWARVVTNFLSTSSLGSFEIIVGNPPWVDWKNLPSGYRDKIKSLCIDRHLFSGDSVTGGINLNICALIASVVAQNWLSENGVMGFLMPEPLVFQQSYEGFRNLELQGGRKLHFTRFVNWNRAGKPFHPVTQKFLTYYLSGKECNYSDGVPMDCYVKTTRANIDESEDLDVEKNFAVKRQFLATCTEGKNLFTVVDNSQQAASYRKIAGESCYTGREGIEFYPQELLVFELDNAVQSRDGYTAVRTIKNHRSKYKLSRQFLLLETAFLHPMIKGPTIRSFHVEEPRLLTPFPYDEREPRYPIQFKELRKRAPKLARYYLENKEVLLAQTGYNNRIIGRSDAEFYALARVGSYSYADYYVAFRDNTKWGAAVVEPYNTAWGGRKRPLFQNHAVSICEDQDGNFITEEEAYYIAGILNAPLVESYVMRSSDSRSFPIRPRINIPKYDPSDANHRDIAKLSKEAHKRYAEDDFIEEARLEIESLYMSSL